MTRGSNISKWVYVQKIFMNQIYLMYSERIKAAVGIFTWYLYSYTSLVYLNRLKGTAFQNCEWNDTYYRSNRLQVVSSILPRVLDQTITSRNNCNGLLLTLDCGLSPTNFHPLSTMLTMVVILRISDFSNYSTDNNLDGPNVNNRLTGWYSLDKFRFIRNSYINVNVFV